MKLFIWEGNGISDAYHDDGTLVVLAKDVREARKVALDQKRLAEEHRAKMQPIYKKHAEWRNARAAEGGGFSTRLWETEIGKEILARDKKVYIEENFTIFDGDNAALNRKPDRVLDIDTPKVVAFNGGGYD